MALIIAWLTPILAWLSLGHPFHPGWALLFLPAILWTLGLFLSRRLPLFLGFLGFLAFAASCVVGGRVFLGLVLLGLDLFAWDCADLFRLPVLDPRQISRARRQTFLWAGLVAGTGVALGVGASLLRVPTNFWALVGGMILVWVLLWLWLRAAAGNHGGKTRGNRSVSAPTK